MKEEFHIVDYFSLPSTQDEAKRLIDIGQCKEAMVIATQSQTQGRGRYTRTWESSTGDLALSIALKPKMELKFYMQIAYIAALAVGGTILKYNTNINLQYKWVNDILVNQRKIAGILLEKYKYDILIAGIGLNISTKEHLSHLCATSTTEIGLLADYSKLLHNILAEFFKLYKHWQQYGFAAIRNQWLKRAVSIGENINVRFLTHSISGTFLDIDIEGNMIMNTGNKLIKVNSGEVFNI